MATRADIETRILRIADGDRAAFSSLYDATAAKLFGVVLRVLKERGEAEEVLQEVYIKVWHGAGRYEANGLSPMTWLITIARNTAIDKLRTRARADTTDGMDDAAQAVPDAAPGPEAMAVAAGERGQLEACFAELPPERAEAVRGAYLDGDDYKTLAARHDVPLNTMRTWLRRSLIALRECLSR